MARKKSADNGKVEISLPKAGTDYLQGSVERRRELLPLIREFNDLGKGIHNYVMGFMSTRKEKLEDMAYDFSEDCKTIIFFNPEVERERIEKEKQELLEK